MKHVPVNTIEDTQKFLLYQSIINSKPVKPEFLVEYDLELKKTAVHLRQREKKEIFTDEMKDDTETFTAKIDAYLKKEEREK